MKKIIKNAKTISLLLSKNCMDAAQLNTDLMKSVTRLTSQSVQEKTKHTTAFGNRKLKENLALFKILRHKETSKDRIQGISWLLRAFRANEVLLRNSLTLRFQSDVELCQSKYSGKNVKSNQTQSLEKAKTSLSKARKSLDRLQLQLYTILLENKSPAHIEEACFVLSDNILSMISKLAESQTFLGLAMNQFLNTKPTLVTEKIGLVQSKFNQLGREMVATYISSHFLAYMVYGIPVYKNHDLLIKTHLMPFSTELNNGKDVKILNLKKQKDEKFVEVSGFVDSMERVESKAGNGVRLILKDIKGRLSLPFIFTYSNPESYGIIEGTFCNINGTIKKNHKITGGHAIDVDKLKLKSDLSKIWKYAFLNLSDSVIEVFPRNLNMSWSINLKIENNATTI